MFAISYACLDYFVVSDERVFLRVVNDLEEKKYSFQYPLSALLVKSDRLCLSFRH